MSKMNDKKIKNRKLNPLAVIALAICALAVIYSATTAWLTGEPLNPIRFTTLEDFEYSMNVYFLQDDGSKTYVVQDFKAGDASSVGAISLDFSDASAENYISKLRVEVKQYGDGVAFSRVKISHEYLYTAPGATEPTRLQGVSYLPYTINTDEYMDQRDSDGYIYHIGVMSENDGYLVVVNGFDSANFDASSISGLSGTVELSLNVSVDAVQFNRYQQFWGISSRPWDISTESGD